MKILLAVNHDLVGCYALNLFLEALTPQHQVAVTISDMVMLPKAAPDGSGIARDLQQLAVLEREFPRESFFPLLEAANLSGLSQELKSFTQCAAFYGVPLAYHRNIRTPEALGWFADQSPDLILSVRYGALFQDEHIRLAKQGVWNIHSGILPAYRGVMPTFRAMGQGRADYGITMHSVPDARIDAGDIIAIRRRAVNLQEDMLTHVLALYPLARDMALEAITRLQAGKGVETQPQNPAEQAYYTFPTEAEVTVFQSQGLHLFDIAAYHAFLRRFQAREAAARIAA